MNTFIRFLENELFEKFTFAIRWLIGIAREAREKVSSKFTMESTNDWKTSSRVHWIVKLMRRLCSGTRAPQGRLREDERRMPAVYLPPATFPFAHWLTSLTEGCGSRLLATRMAKKLLSIIFSPLSSRSVAIRWTCASCHQKSIVKFLLKLEIHRQSTVERDTTTPRTAWIGKQKKCFCLESERFAIVFWPIWR